MPSTKSLPAILSRIEAAENHRKAKYEDKWRDCYRRYTSKPEGKRDGSNIFVPYTFMICATVQARIAESLFANRPYVTVLPREDTDAAQAELLQTLLDWQLNDRICIRRVLGEEILQSLIVYGTAIAYTGWKLVTRRMKYPQITEQLLTGPDGMPMLDEAGQIITVPQREIIDAERAVYDDPVAQCIDLFDFFCDPYAADIAEARYCGHKEYQTRVQLEDLVRQGKYKIDFKKLAPATDIEKAAQVKRGEGNSGEEDEGGESGLYLVHHYWEDSRHVVLINREQVALDEDNPFWHGLKPYDKCCYQPLSGEFYGVGIPELCAQLQDELNTNRNQRVDYNSLALRRMWKIRRGSGVTQEDLIWRQNGVIEVNDPADVLEINVQELPASAFANEDNIKKDMRDATGCHDIIMGLATYDETATTTMTKDNNASLRFKDVVGAVERDILVPLVQKCMSLNQQFMSEEKAVRITNDQNAGELLMIDPEAISGSYDIIYVGTAIDAMANKEMAKERTLQVFNLLAGDPLYQQDNEARLALMRKVMEAQEMKDVDGLLPALPPPMPQMGQPGMQEGAEMQPGQSPMAQALAAQRGLPHETVRDASMGIGAVEGV